MRKLTAKEAAKLIGVTTTTIRSYVKRDLLKAELKGVARKYFFDVEDMRKFAGEWNFDFDEQGLKQMLKEEG